MNLPTTQSTSYTLRPSMPLEYKEHLNLYMKEYRQQHKDATTARHHKYATARHIKMTSTYEKKDANIQKNIIAK